VFDDDDDDESDDDSGIEAPTYDAESTAAFSAASAEFSLFGAFDCYS